MTFIIMESISERVCYEQVLYISLYHLHSTVCRLHTEGYMVDQNRLKRSY